MDHISNSRNTDEDKYTQDKDMERSIKYTKDDQLKVKPKWPTTLEWQCHMTTIPTHDEYVLFDRHSR